LDVPHDGHDTTGTGSSESAGAIGAAGGGVDASGGGPSSNSNGSNRSSNESILSSPTLLLPAPTFSAREGAPIEAGLSAAAIVPRMTVVGALREVDPWTRSSMVAGIVLAAVVFSLVVWLVIRYLRG
jgi:hypothetical protein